MDGNQTGLYRLGVIDVSSVFYSLEQIKDLNLIMTN